MPFKAAKIIGRHNIPTRQQKLICGRELCVPWLAKELYNMTEEGFELLKSFEGCKLKAYKCPAGVPTIGYGNTFYADGHPVKLGDEITQEEAEELLKKTVATFEKKVRKLLPNDLPQLSVDALVSFAYNVGVQSLEKSTLLRFVKSEPTNMERIKTHFMSWAYAGKKKLKGLERRREKEFALYCKGFET